MFVYRTWSPFANVIYEQVYAYIYTYNYMWKHTYDSVFFGYVWLTENSIFDFSWNLLGFILNPDKKKKKKTN